MSRSFLIIFCHRFWGFFVCIVLALSATHVATGEALEEFAYREITVKFVSLNGVPMRDAYIYGYCRDLHLVCPKFSSKQRQYDLPWKESYLGKTGPKGTAVFKLPPGNWAFFATGTLGARIVAAWTNYQALPLNGLIILKPKVVRNWTFKVPAAGASMQRLLHKRFFIKPEHLPIYIPTTVSSPRVVFEIPKGSAFTLWGQGDAFEKQAGFIINWGQLDEQTANGSIQPGHELANLDINGATLKASIRWYLPWQHGLSGRIKLRNGIRRVLLSPDSYSLGYERLVSKNALGDFVAKRYELQSGQSQVLNFDTKFRAGLAVQPGEKGTYGCLYVIDSNAHLLRKLIVADKNKPLNIRCSVRVDGRVYRADRKKSGDHTYFLIPVDVRNHEQSWQFNIPLPGVMNRPFTPDKLVTLTSRRFHIIVPEILTDVAANHLVQLDEYEDRVREVSGRTKRRVANTELKVRIDNRGASATHSGQYIRIGPKIFFRDNPALWHDFAHELCHNFALVHGGMHELIVETARCYGDDLISGQASKWLFMDRMNGLQGRERWYPYTAFYLYAYSRGGLNFLRFASDNDLRLRRNTKKAGLSRGEALAGFMSVALDRDMFAVSRMYGLSDSSRRYKQSVKAVEQFIRLR